MEFSKTKTGFPDQLDDFGDGDNQVSVLLGQDAFLRERIRADVGGELVRQGGEMQECVLDGMMEDSSVTAPVEFYEIQTRAGGGSDLDQSAGRSHEHGVGQVRSVRRHEDPDLIHLTNLVLERGSAVNSEDLKAEVFGDGFQLLEEFLEVLDAETWLLSVTMISLEGEIRALHHPNLESWCI